MNAALDTENIRLEFISESRDLLERAETAVLQLEQNSTPEGINDLFRLVHTVKGNVGFFRNKRLTGVAHELETLLNAVRNKTLVIDETIIDMALAAIDWLRRALGNPDTELTADPHLEETLRSARSAGAPTQKAPAAGPRPQKQIAPEQLKVPARLIKEAKSRGKELVIVKLDLSARDSLTPAALQAICAAAQKAGDIAFCRVQVNAVPDLSALNGGALPAVILYGGDAPVTESLKKLGLPSDNVKPIVISQPAGRPPEQNAPTAPVVEPLPDVRESSDADRTTDHLRVPLVLIDRLIDLAGATVGVRNELNQRLMVQSDSRLQLVGNRLGQMITRLQEEIMRTRLQELGTLFKRIPRVVRDVCRLTGKEAEVAFEGKEVELDKNLIDVIGEAILHMVRNSVDHGIEPPEERIRLGKPRAGLIKITATVKNGSVALSIADDGRGLNYKALKESAVKRNLITPAQAEALTDEDAAELIFAPGLSTAKAITETSGRGVGMDVVRESFNRAGGTVGVHSVQGKGTTFAAALPQTLSIVTCLTLTVAGDRYAAAQTGVEELVRFDPRHASKVGDQLLYKLRDKSLALLDLNALLYGVPADMQRELFIVVVRSDRHRYGLLVQEIGNPEEILIKPLGIHFEGNPLYSGAAVLGDGSIARILDIAGVARFANLQMAAEEKAQTVKADQTLKKDWKNFLIFEAQGARFAVSTEYSPRIERFSRQKHEAVMGGEIIRHDDMIIPLLYIGRMFNAAAKTIPEFTVLVAHGGVSVALAADAVITVQKDLEHEQSDSFNHPAISSRATVDGHTVLAVNVPVLLAGLESDAFRAAKEIV